MSIKNIYINYTFMVSVCNRPINAHR